MEQNTEFIRGWDHYMTLGAYGCAGIAVLILLYHEFRIFQIKDYKEKYDYVNLHEINYFWYAIIALIIATALYANAVSSKAHIFANETIWFYVRSFITVSFIVIAYFIFNSLVRIYYPRYVEKRLMKLRNRPRVSPEGNIMRKLREEEEETHLEQSQFEEQKNIHSVDYDVWLDEKTGYKKIEKYNAFQHAIECSECGYVTMRLHEEEVIEAPTNDSPGTLLQHYRCTYCKHREAKEVTVAQLSKNLV
jgi:hypothetical protein